MTQPPYSSSISLFVSTPCDTRCGDLHGMRSPQARSRPVSRSLHVALLISFLLVVLPLVVSPVAAAKAPVAAFTASPTAGVQPLAVTFTDTSTNTPTSWSWNFGDGYTSTLQNPSHTYTTGGTYTVSLTATNSKGSNTLTRTSYITVDPPVAAFSALPVTGPAPLTVQFTDESTGSIPTYWEWTFGDGWMAAGGIEARNPSNTYTTPGTYTVTLHVANAAGGNTLTRTGYITVTSGGTPPVAAFSGTPTSGSAPLTVTFTDQSTSSPTSWSWDFGDSTGSTSQNPSHSYAAAGTYTVTLTATNANGSDAEARTGYITVTEPAPTPTPTPTPTPSVVNGSSLSLSTSADAISVRRGDLVNITVEMTGLDSLPSDSIVLVDRSGDSMYACMERDASYHCLGTRWDYAKEGAQIVFNNLNTQHNKFGLFTFAKRGVIEHSFVSSPVPLNNILESMTYEPWSPTLTPWSGPDTLGYPGTSNLRDGLYKALTEIKDKGKSGNAKNLVVFTDGEYNYYGNPLAWGRGYAYTTKVRNYWFGQTGCGNSFTGTYTLVGNHADPDDTDTWVDRMVWPRTSSRNLFPVWDYQMYDDLQGAEYKNFTGFDFVASNQCAQKIDPLALWFPQSATDWPSNPMGHTHPNIEQYTSTDYEIEVCDPSWPYIDASGVKHGNCALTEQNMSVYARNNGIRIYVVVISTNADLDTGLPGGINTSDDIMKILALSTGGKYYPVRNHAALLAALADINRDVSNAATDDLTMDLSDRDVQVNGVVTPNTAGSTQFGHVHREGISTTIHSWDADGEDLVSRYTIAAGSDWNGNGTHTLHYDIGDLAAGDTWQTVYTIQPWVRGTISVFGNTSKVTLDGTTFTLPETLIDVENAPPVFDDVGEQTMDLHETLTFTVSATDADGDALTYSAVSLPPGATFDSGSLTFSWAPTGKGTYSASFQVSDGMATDSLTVPITVTDTRARIRIR
jgi:PKD repeat protein